MRTRPVPTKDSSPAMDISVSSMCWDRWTFRDGLPHPAAESADISERSLQQLCRWVGSGQSYSFRR